VGRFVRAEFLHLNSIHRLAEALELAEAKGIGPAADAHLLSLLQFIHFFEDRLGILRVQRSDAEPYPAIECSEPFLPISILNFQFVPACVQDLLKKLGQQALSPFSFSILDLTVPLTGRGLYPGPVQRRVRCCSTRPGR